jgi:hypothetical protein
MRYTFDPERDSQPWLTPLPPGTYIRRFGISRQTLTAAELNDTLQGVNLPNHYRRGRNGLLLPVRYDEGDES